MKKNNHGFIATAVLYSLAILIGIILFLILKNLATSRTIERENSQNIKEQLLYYDIVFDGNGNTSGTMQNMRVPAGKVTKLLKCQFQRDGHTFDGWSETPTGEKMYDDEGTVRKTQTGEKVSLYAIWKANTYKIGYDANGGSEAPSEQTYTYSDSGTINLSTTIPTRAGYTFLGWSLSPSATSASYSAGQAWNRSNASNYTLYAIWRVNTYKITYNANGGSGAPGQQSYTYASSGTINLSTTIPTRAGYTFLGWSLSPGATSASYSAGQAWNRNNALNYTLYAVWKVSTTTVNAPTLSYIRHEVTGVHGSLSQTERLDSYSVSGNKVYWSWKYASSGSSYIYTKVAQTYNVTDYKYLRVTINQEEKVEASGRSKIRVGSASASFGPNAGTSSVVLDISGVTGNQTIYFDAYMAFNRNITYTNFTGYIYLTELYFYN